MLTAVQRKAIRAAAARGASVLDLARPGWEQRAKIKKLRQRVPVPDAQGCGCVLAQEFGSYGAGLSALAVGEDGGFESSRYVGAVRLGFNLPLTCLMLRGSWPELTEAWRDEIRARRAKAKAPA